MVTFWFIVFVVIDYTTKIPLCLTFTHFFEKLTKKNRLISLILQLAPMRFLLIATVVAVMAQGLVCGKGNCKDFLINLISQFMFLTFRLEQVNGTKLSTKCLALYHKIGEEGR